MQVSLSSPVATEFARARGPIPALGGIVRYYVVPNVAITGQLTAFKIPDSIDSRYNAHYIESVFAGEQRERGVVFADLRINELALVLGDVRRVRSDNVHAAVELGKRLGDVSEM